MIKVWGLVWFFTVNHMGRYPQFYPKTVTWEQPRLPTKKKKKHKRKNAPISMWKICDVVIRGYSQLWEHIKLSSWHQFKAYRWSVLESNRAPSTDLNRHILKENFPDRPRISMPFNTKISLYLPLENIQMIYRFMKYHHISWMIFLKNLWRVGK